jgi:hypothetical protein
MVRFFCSPLPVQAPATLFSAPAFLIGRGLRFPVEVLFLALIIFSHSDSTYSIQGSYQYLKHISR